MLRATFLEFPGDRSTWDLDTQYMLGSSLLVAPVFNAKGKVEFYLPEGTWYGIIDGKMRQGLGYVKETHDFDSITLLLRPGSAIILGKGGKSVKYDWSSQCTVLINPEDGMDVDIEIPESEVGQLGKFKSKLRVRVTKEKLLVTVHDGKISKGWKVQVAGRKLLKRLVGGVEQEVALESENIISVQTTGVKSVELSWPQ
jgi:alpha-D-xyloside xylohydrolase